jgi:Flp pilus assembly protein TadD
MPFRLLHGLRAFVRRPRLVLLTAILLALVGYLAWRGGIILWVRWDRAEAEKAVAEYDFAEARRRLSRCIRLQPRDPELRLLAARTARRDGDLDSAREELHIARELSGESSPAGALELALLTAGQGHVHEVVDTLIERLEEHHPQSEQILEALAVGCVQNYELHRALFWINELLEKWPNNGIGRLLRAQTVDTYGNREKALALLADLVKDIPKYVQARTSLAEMLSKSRRYREAAVEYAVLVEQCPGTVIPLLGLASSYDRMGEIDKARPLMRQLEVQYPDHSGVALECGRFALVDKRPEDAERLLRRAAELSPSNNEVHRHLSMCLEQLGKHEEAHYHLSRCGEIEADLKQLEKSLQVMMKSPNDPKPRREVGELCLRNGQVSEGLRWLQGALDIAPNDRPTRQALADYYASQGDSERANFYANNPPQALPKP